MKNLETWQENKSDFENKCDEYIPAGKRPTLLIPKSLFKFYHNEMGNFTISS